jgi:hypothetical protein
VDLDLLTLASLYNFHMKKIFYLYVRLTKRSKLSNSRA